MNIEPIPRAPREKLCSKIALGRLASYYSFVEINMLPHSLDIAWHGKCWSGVYIPRKDFCSLLPTTVSGGGAVGGMLGWPNGADPPLSHDWCQCQHIDFVCK